MQLAMAVWTVSPDFRTWAYRDTNDIHRRTQGNAQLDIPCDRLWCSHTETFLKPHGRSLLLICVDFYLENAHRDEQLYGYHGVDLLWQYWLSKTGPTKDPCDLIFRLLYQTKHHDLRR